MTEILREMATPEQWAKLTAPFEPHEIGHLPRVWCKECREARFKHCDQHPRAECQRCASTLTTAHVCLPYLGHAEVTHRLNQYGGEWSWKPLARTDAGAPLIERHQSRILVMWAELTVYGRSVIEVGTCKDSKDEAHKELVGDFLRRGAMRLGIGLDLWAKTTLAERSSEALDDPETQGVADEVLDGDQVAAIRAVFDEYFDDPEARRVALGEFAAGLDVALEFTPRGAYLDTLKAAGVAATAAADARHSQGMIVEARAAHRGATIPQLKKYATEHGVDIAGNLPKLDLLLRIMGETGNGAGDIVAEASAPVAVPVRTVSGDFAVVQPGSASASGSFSPVLDLSKARDDTDVLEMTANVLAADERADYIAAHDRAVAGAYDPLAAALAAIPQRFAVIRPEPF